MHRKPQKSQKPAAAAAPPRQFDTHGCSVFTGTNGRLHPVRWCLTTLNCSSGERQCVVHATDMLTALAGSRNGRVLASLAERFGPRLTRTIHTMQWECAPSHLLAEAAGAKYKRCVAAGVVSAGLQLLLSTTTARDRAAPLLELLQRDTQMLGDVVLDDCAAPVARPPPSDRCLSIFYRATVSTTHPGAVRHDEAVQSERAIVERLLEWDGADDLRRFDVSRFVHALNDELRPRQLALHQLPPRLTPQNKQ